MTEKFIIRMVEDIAVVEDETGQRLAERDWQLLHERIHRGYLRLCRQTAAADLDELLNNAEWVMPVSTEDLRASGPCVYFLEHPTHPGLVKIGSTTQLARRLASYERELGSPITVLAYIRIPGHRDLERSLHAYLDHARINPGRRNRNEWFSRDAVTAFLTSYREQPSNE